tara:strand:+ start:10236 stop:10547 length:312 start_codon:yes stop_codon:yes gene_type:complete
MKKENQKDQNLRPIHEKYSGGNLDILAASGYQEDDVVLTFKQAMKSYGVTGNMLKGLAGKGTSLFFYKEEINKETGLKEKVRKYFTVFSANDCIKAIESNKVA